MSYHHFNTEDRIKLEGFLKAGLKQTEIAKILGFAPKSISLEISRGINASKLLNPGKNTYSYSARIADHDAKQKRARANQNKRILSSVENEDLAKVIEKKLKKRWSPEQIAGALAAGSICIRGVHRKIKIAVQTIYDWIYEFRKDLQKFLRRNHRYHRKRQYYINKKRREELQRERGIEKRPAHIDKRTRFGHWEGDTVVGAQNGATGRIATFTERKSGYLIACKIDALTEEEKKLGTARLELLHKTISLQFADGCIEHFNKKITSKYAKTLTLDNGSENAAYERIERCSGLKVFFAHPYHSWERGTNENTNGLLRQYFPKGMDFRSITQEALDKVVYEINNRPRKRLNWQTPQHVMRRIGALK